MKEGWDSGEGEIVRMGDGGEEGRYDNRRGIKAAANLRLKALALRLSLCCSSESCSIWLLLWLSSAAAVIGPTT